MYQTEILAPTPTGIARAASLLRVGDLVAFPTETVYGLGGDARSNLAVARIFDAKLAQQAGYEILGCSQRSKFEAAFLKILECSKFLRKLIQPI